MKTPEELLRECRCDESEGEMTKREQIELGVEERRKLMEAQAELLAPHYESEYDRLKAMKERIVKEQLVREIDIADAIRRVVDPILSFHLKETDGLKEEIAALKRDKEQLFQALKAAEWFVPKGLRMYAKERELVEEALKMAEAQK